MKTVGCTLKLTNDGNDPQNIRRCDLSITGSSSAVGNGTWNLTNDSPDPRLTIGADSGIWFLMPYSDDSDHGNLEIYGTDPSGSTGPLVVILFNLPWNFLAHIGCGSGLSGEGSHKRPPQSDIVFSIWFGCA
jgi:hypothetical protein